MALPTSGTITMAMVKAELGLSSSTVLTLTDSRVRTLFGKPTGDIKLTDGYGKSSIVVYRPIGVNYSGTTPTNPTYAYDTPATPNSVDFSTYNDSMATGATVTHTQYYSFGLSGTASGLTLRVGVKMVQTENDSGVDKFGNDITLSSYVRICYTLDGESSWNYADFSPRSGYFDGLTSDSASNLTLTKLLPIGQLLRNVKVRVDCHSMYDATYKLMASARVQISDIVIY